MRILIIGGGGREHALAHTFHRQGHQVICAPGNGGTREFCETADGDLLEFAQSVDLTVVGPEAPLAGGIVDTFTQQGLKIFGPTREATQLESSKVWAKMFMAKHGIPTGRFHICSSPDQAKKAATNIFRESGGVVIKPDGLTAGKGVTCCNSIDSALLAIKAIMEDSLYGSAGQEVVIEELLTGPEVSILTFCDGKTMVPMLPSQDHKRLLDGGRGPNTGGVGAYAPLPFVSTEELTPILEQTNKALKKERITYKGVLYFGLMLTQEGPKILEFNCRFGDPEAQVVLPLLESDLAEIMLACCNGNLSPELVSWKNQSACCVVMSSEGYPKKYLTGYPIAGLDTLPESVICFHAGTSKDSEGRVVTAGGRVLGVTGIGDTLERAIDRAYSAVERIHFQGAQYRKDIASQGKYSFANNSSP